MNLCWGDNYPDTGGKGNCWDNAPMESFFHTLKLECTDDIKFETREEAMNNIFDYGTVAI